LITYIDFLMVVKSVHVESLSASLDSCVPCLVVSLKVLLVKVLYYRLSSHLDIWVVLCWLG